MERFLEASIAAIAAVFWVASPAIAHEEVSPSSIPIGKPVFLTLSAANEKGIDLTRITVTAPAGAPFGTTTRQPAGWTAQKSDTDITWTGGKVAPYSFEQWGFEIEGADQPGALEFKVNTGFTDGTSDNHDVVITAVAPGSGDNPVIAPPERSASTSAPSATTTLAPAKKSSSNDGGAVSAIVIALLSGLLAGVALVVSLRSRTGNPATKGEDW